MSTEVDILVTEDDTLICAYVTTILQSAGYGVTRAESGLDALEALDAGLRPKLLFTDVIMADGMNGIELAKRARLILPKIRIIFTTGYTAMLEREQLPAGAQLLAKPFRRKNCLEAVRYVMAER